MIGMDGCFDLGGWSSALGGGNVGSDGSLSGSGFE